MSLIGARPTGGRWAVAALVTLAAIATPTAAHAASTAVGATTVTSSTSWPAIGSPTTIRFTADLIGTTPPAKFVYEINGRTESVRATGGTASVQYTPVARMTQISAYGVARDGTAGPAGSLFLQASAPTPYADKDLDHDGVPDLLSAGGTPGLPSGLWQATGRTGDTARAAGKVKVPAVDIGVNGNGVGGGFDGAQIITGQFTGSNFTDVLVYYPGGINPGSGMVINGAGDGSVLQAQHSGNEHTISAGLLSDLNGDNPRQLVNAYNAAGGTYLYPDLLGAFSGALEYYASQNGINNYAFPVTLTNATPDGGNDWASWTLASLRLPTGLAVFLWNGTTGALYLWTGVTFTDHGDFTGSLAFTQTELSVNWNRGVALADLQAADFGGDGVPDLWAIGTDGSVTAYVGGTQRNAPQQLLG